MKHPLSLCLAAPLIVALTSILLGRVDLRPMAAAGIASLVRWVWCTYVEATPHGAFLRDFITFFMTVQAWTIWIICLGAVVFPHA